MLQIEKIETYSNAKIKLKKLPAENLKATEVLREKKKAFEKVYLVDELDTPPKLKAAEFDTNCLIDCLYASFNSSTKYFIDYSKVEGDTSYLIHFIVDKEGKINNITIQSKENKPNDTKRRFPNVIFKSEQEQEYTEKKAFSEIEEGIASSILAYQNNLIAGEKNGEKVNTKLHLEVRLIAK